MMAAQEWARLPENRILAEASFPILRAPQSFAGHPGCLPWVYDYLLADYSEPARFVECCDATIVLWTYPYEDGFVDYLLYPFTSQMNGLARDRYRIKVAPFVRAYDEETGAATFDLTEAEDFDQEISAPCYYVGGRDNFLHWLIDHLALAVLPGTEEYIKDRALLTGQLAPWQRELLDFFDVRADVIELPSAEHGSCLVRCRNLMIPVGFPLKERFLALRTRFSQLQGGVETSGPNIYLSRGALRPRHRVANEEDVAAYFVSEGFLVLYPERMTTGEIASHCSKADIIATAPGSANGNFFVFSKSTAVLIYMVPEHSKGETSYAQATVGYANLLVFIERLVTVFGRAVDPNKHSRILEDAEEVYDLGDLAAGLRKARSLKSALDGLGANGAFENDN